MNVLEIILKKRNGELLSEEEIGFIITSYTKGKIPDYQFSAFLMAVYFRGMEKKETTALTKSMLFSGKVINLGSIRGAKIDKHSTGGVGDKTSLILAPIVAAAGITVPMISGRGLGHTGGTIDKLEAIPGFKTNLSLIEYKSLLKRCRVALIAPTKDIAPADKLIYSLRDVTATVESIPLITGSIMSKKLAEGIDGLVLDIKTGNGAFMRTLKDSRELAYSLIDTAKAFNKKVIGFITDMNQPLGNYIGNWLEVYESIKILQGEKVKDLIEISLALSGAMIYLGGKASSIKEVIEISKEMIKNGKAFEKFLEIVKLQGGNDSFIKNPETYPRAKTIEKVKAEKNGYFSGVDNYQLGMISLHLGAGRLTKEDKIDPKAGIIFYPKIGDKIKRGDVIAELYTDKKTVVNHLKKKLGSIIYYSDKKVPSTKLIREVIL
jgi:pyrimidine-nucleoside phosphorylase